MKTDFEQRKQNRLEAYKRLATKNQELSTSTYNRAKNMASIIPFGQPILIGHYSENRDRNYRDRIHNTYGKSFQLADKAKYYEQRAETVENNTAISSDDPEAIQKLKEKLAGLEKLQLQMKTANQIIRSKKSDDQKIKLLLEILPGTKEETLRKFLSPDQFGGPGFPSFKLSNNNQNIATVKKRIAYLSRMEKQETNEITIKDITITDNAEANRTQIFFSGIPEKEKREELKHKGFRWTPSLKCWQKFRNPYSMRETIELIKKWYE